MTACALAERILTGEDLAEIDLLPVEADSAAGGVRRSAGFTLKLSEREFDGVCDGSELAE